MTRVRIPLRGTFRGTPLRVRLAAAVTALVAVGLAVSGFVATSALHSYLLQRVDNQLLTTQFPPNACTGFSGGHGGGSRDPEELPTQFYVVTYTPSGARQCSSTAAGEGVAPKLPALDSTTAGQMSEHPFTVASTAGGSSWRVAVTTFADGDSRIVGLRLSDVDHTVGRLALLETVIGAVVLGLLAAAAYAVMKRSLLPLVEVEHTAAAIAAGDLSRRVPDHDPRTEIGRLTRALNGMLGQVERAFAHQRSSEQQARASEERMRRFVADASHELRTPLTSIRGFAELHRQGAVAGGREVTQVMRRVEDEATRMGLLVDDLLMLARLDQERPLVQAPVDLLTVAGDVVHDARAVDRGRPIELTVLDGPPAIVIGDEARLRQVVTNLVSNALRHTPAASPVHVTVGTTTDGGAPRAVVEVADQGPGLSPEAADRVFERFYRVDPARARESGGAGLGLSIVAAIVAAHGGRVAVDTAPGAGATFRVLLPLAEPG